MVQPRPPRLFVAADVLAGKVNLDRYPFRYVCVAPSPSTVLGAGLSGRSGSNALLDQVLSAVELLETRGWEVVSFDQGGMAAFLRRRA